MGAPAGGLGRPVFFWGAAARGGARSADSMLRPMALYVVTGGAGFIGSHLADALVARGDRVRVLDDLSSGRRENLAGHRVGELGSGAPVELLVGDIRDA